MEHLVVLSLGHGDWQQGFPMIMAQIWQSDRPTPTKLTGSLAAAPDLPDLYRRWQKLYEALHGNLGLRRVRGELALEIEIEAEDLVQVSTAEFQALSQQLKRQINQWIGSGSFGRIERRLRTQLDPADSIRIIIETEDPQLRRLPWHLWSFFEDYPKAEVALSALEYDHIDRLVQAPRAKVRILAVLGNSQGIDVEKDRAILTGLTNAETVFLVEPERQELNQWLWDEQGWDILCFAGHSCSQANDAQGQLEINRQDSLSIAQLRHALKAAIARGLQLAIFNSCDGLGLARELADLYIPQLIVMREPVPDTVAEAFLKHFLTGFAGGQPLYQAVREAREKLQGLESQFPSASWLPVICQNPAVPPPTWHSLRGLTPDQKPAVVPVLQRDRPKLLSRTGLRLIGLASLMVTSVLVGARSLGWLQTWELQSFNQLMRLRPAEAPDDRFLVISVGEADIQYQDQQQMPRRGSLSDVALSQLLAKLTPHQPRVIGLDIYHDFAFEPQLAAQIAQNPHFIATCEVGISMATPTSIAAPPAMPPEQISFTDFPSDPDDTIRRQLLGMSSSQDCPTSQALSLTLALDYLAQVGNHALTRTPEGTVQISNVTFPRLEQNSGGYQLQTEDIGGYQVLLNYRAAPFAEIALQDVLNGSLQEQLPNLVRNRIVLIGVASRSRDAHLTPFDTLPYPEKMSGVLLHTHMASQIISAVLDRRPLIWWWPQWVEVIWIAGWAGLGSIIGLGMRSPLHLTLSGMTGLLVVAGCSYWLFVQGGWIPLIPAGLALITAGVGIWLYVAFVHPAQP